MSKEKFDFTNVNNYNRTGEPDVEVSWNPKNGEEKPYEVLLDCDNWYEPVKYLRFDVCKMNGKLYYIKKHWYDFHPDLDNTAILVPLRKM